MVLTRAEPLCLPAPFPSLCCAVRLFLPPLIPATAYSPSQLLIDEAGFLMEVKTRKMVDSLPANEQGKVKLDTVLRALGITDGIAFDAMLDALSADSSVEARARNLGRTGGAAVEELAKDQRTMQLVHPDDVVRRLKAFIEVENAQGSTRAAGGTRVAGKFLHGLGSPTVLCGRAPLQLLRCTLASGLQAATALLHREIAADAWP